MAKENVRSKTLAVLDALGVKYTIKAAEAKLKDWDSLSIHLAGDYAGFWTRWSRNVKGRNYKDLVAYMVSEGLVAEEDAKRVLGGPIEGREVSVKRTETYDFKTMVTNPRTQPIEKWLTQVRKLSPALVKRFIDLGLVVRDGRDNIRFLWRQPDGEITGADVQGIVYDPERFGKRGTLKLILPGSHGFFNVKGRDVDHLIDVENIYITEAPIDLMSLIELGAVSDTDREETSFELPTLKPKSLYVAVSGSLTKLETTMNRLEMEYGIDPKKVNSIVVATDNDETGLKSFDWFKENGYTNAEQLLPNANQSTLIHGVVGKVNDWNELLKLYKEELEDNA